MLAFVISRQEADHLATLESVVDKRQERERRFGLSNRTACKPKDVGHVRQL